MSQNAEHPETGLALSEAEKAKKLLTANKANIGRKVLAQQTLSAFEVKLLEQEIAAAKDAAAKEAQALPDSAIPKFVKNQVQLAAVLGCERKTIQRARLKPGAPKARSDGRWNVHEWRTFLEQLGAIGSNDPDKAALQAEQLLLQNQRLRNKLAIERKEWIPRIVARQVFTQLVTEAKARSFNSIIRLVTLARVAANTTDAAAEVRKEVEQVWKSLENSEWFHPK